MLFSFTNNKTSSCLSVGIGFCLEVGYNGKRFSL